jgi:hypothetical protein
LELGLDCTPACSTASDLQLAANAYGSLFAGFHGFQHFHGVLLLIYVIVARAGLCL